MFVDDPLHEGVEFGGGDAFLAFGDDFVGEGEDLEDVFGVFGGNEDYFGPRDEGEAAAEFGDDVVTDFFAGFEKVDFVDGEDQAFVFGEGVFGDVAVLAGDAGVAVHQKDDDLAAFDGADTAEGGEFFDAAFDFAAAAEAGGVDEVVGFVFEGDFGVGGIAGGAGNVGDDDFVLTDEGVDEGGFAGVWFAENGDLA